MHYLLAGTSIFYRIVTPFAERNNRVHYTVTKYRDIAKSLAAYVLWHQQVTSAQIPVEQRKFLHLRAERSSGHGNRLMTLVSAFGLAVVTHRALIIHQVEFDGLENPGFDWFAPIPEGPVVNFDFKGMKSVEPAKCDDLMNLPQTTLEMLSDRNFLDIFLKENQYVGPEAVRLFGRGDAFGILARFIVRPSAAVQNNVKSFVSQHFVDHYSVGLQIRKGVGSHDAMFNVQHPHHEAIFHQCTSTLLQQRRERSDNRQNVTIFVATDSPDAIDVMRNELERDSSVRVVSFSEGKGGTMRGMHTLDLALTDMLLLAMRDDLIITQGSTFGFMAEGLGSVLYLMVTKDKCIRAPSSEPCCTACEQLHKTVCAGSQPKPPLLNRGNCAFDWQDMVYGERGKGA